MRALTAIALCIVLAQPGNAWSSDTIPWDPERPLTWADFQGPVPRGTDDTRVASTTSSIAWSYEYSIEWSEAGCVFVITRLNARASFDPATSWVRSGHRTAEVLQHEQGHFDIAQIFNEKFREATRELVGASRTCEGRSRRRAASNAEREAARLVGAVYDEVWHQYERRQATYDGETRHGIDREAQARWTRGIAESLQRGE